MNVHSECNNKESNIYCHCSFFAEGMITRLQNFKITVRSLIVIKSFVIWSNIYLKLLKVKGNFLSCIYLEVTRRLIGGGVLEKMHIKYIRNGE